MSLKNASDIFNKQLETIYANRVEDALSAGMDVIALSRRRVISQRVNHFDEEFGEYAEATHRRKKDKQRNANSKKINFVQEGIMMRTILPFVSEVTNTHIVMIVEPSDEQRAEVFEIHQERFGPLMMLNQREQLIFLQLYEGKVNNRMP